MARQNHRDRIYDILLQRIQRGEVGWEERLVDVTLAGEMGVSRMPVRDALMRLTAEGYLVSTTRGFSLPDLSNEEVLEIFELRKLLEPRAAALAAQAMDKKTFTELDRAVAIARGALASGNITDLFRASETFRSGWLGAAPNRTLVETIRRYFTQVQKVRLTTMRERATLSIIVSGQIELLRAFGDRDPIAAHDRMQLFVLEGEQAFRRVMAAAEPLSLSA